MFITSNLLKMENEKIEEPLEDSLLEFQITHEDHEHFRRLDHLLAAKVPGYSRNFLKNLFEDDLIYSDDKKLELKKLPSIGTKVIVEIPPPIDGKAQAENIPLDILFEDEYLVIVNKAAGMVTHPAPGNYTGTLVNAILHHCPDLKGIGNVKRPGIVHRLDKGTSGVMVVAKTQETHEKLVTMFSKHDLTRIYECITFPVPDKLSGKLESLIGRSPNNRLKMAINGKSGKKAITHFKVLKKFTKHAHIECQLDTGRTHQIRVHLGQLLHCPIFNDILYANVPQQKNGTPKTTLEIMNEYPYPFLHAKILSFVHPITNNKLDFSVTPPAIFQNVLASLQ